MKKLLVINVFLVLVCAFQFYIIKDSIRWNDYAWDEIKNLIHENANLKFGYFED